MPPAQDLNLAAIAESVRKTGFDLEYRACEALRRAGWSTISNKYYLDDHSEQAREIDIVAYRAGKVEGVSVYTVLIVSCKKSEENAWVLLSRPVVSTPRDVDWRPLHMYTNHKVFRHLFEQATWAKTYHEEMIGTTAAKALAPPRVDIFAFQEVSKVKSAPRNDKQIFDAISGLMKAQSYELASLAVRKRNVPCIYQFNLLALVDAPLVCVEYGEDSNTAMQVQQEHYIARYIVRKNETFARIRFATASAFQSIVGEYDALHTANLALMGTQVKSFYEGLVQDPVRVAVLRDDFVVAINANAPWVLRKIGGKTIDVADVFWNLQKRKVIVAIPMESSRVETFRSSAVAMGAIRDALKTVYRYEGDFDVEEELDF